MSSYNKQKSMSVPCWESDDDLPDLTLEQLRSFTISDGKASSHRAEKQETESSPQANWDDPLACHLEHLLFQNLLGTFCCAVSKIIECGYSMEDAEWAVLNISLLHGSKDFLAEVVDAALALLKEENVVSLSKDSTFQGLVSLAEYKIVEMIRVLLEVKPHLTITEAMWCLLISDFNLLNACGADEGTRGNCLTRKIRGDSLELSQLNIGIRDASQTDSTKLELAGTRKENNISLPKQQGSFSMGHIQAKSPIAAVGEKPTNLAESHGHVVDLIDSQSPASSVVSDPYPPKFIAETPNKCVPRDEIVLKLVAHKRALDNEVEAWTEWANGKVLQVTQRLGKELADLKMLRQMKTDAEKVKNTVKQLSEMETRLSKARGDVEGDKSTICLIRRGNSLFEKKREAVQLEEMASVTKLREAVEREKEALKKCQSWNEEKQSLQEKLTNLKGKSSVLEAPVARAKACRDELKDLLKQEECDKAKVAMQIEALMKKKEQIETSTNDEAEKMKQAAEADLQKHKEEIIRLKHKISELKLQPGKSKKAGVKVGYGENPPKLTTRLPVFENLGSGRECVMCMTEEISVVFLPCAHQVLCGGCNELHEKKGMEDCPTCRTVIQKRITVLYPS